MKNSIKILSFSLIVTLSLACRKEVEIDLSKYQAKITVNSVFEQDSNFYFHITESQSRTDNDTFPPLKDVKIILRNSEGEEDIITNLVARNYYGTQKMEYKSNMIVKSGLTYFLEIEHPNYDKVTADATVPSGTVINSLDTFSTYEFGFPVLRFDMRFKDPEVPNYYELKTFFYGPKIIYDDKYWEPIDTVMAFQEIYYSLPSDGIFSGGGTVFSDEFFNGKEYSLSFTVDKYYIDYLTHQVPGFTTEKSYILVELRSLSEDYYKYQTTYNSFQNADGNPFAQPVQVFSNIEGGYGIFAGFGKSSDTLWLE